MSIGRARHLRTRRFVDAGQAHLVEVGRHEVPGERVDAGLSFGKPIVAGPAAQETDHQRQTVRVERPALRGVEQQFETAGTLALVAGPEHRGVERTPSGNHTKSVARLRTQSRARRGDRSVGARGPPWSRPAGRRTCGAAGRTTHASTHRHRRSIRCRPSCRSRATRRSVVNPATRWTDPVAARAAVTVAPSSGNDAAGWTGNDMWTMRSTNSNRTWAGSSR